MKNEMELMGLELGPARWESRLLNFDQNYFNMDRQKILAPPERPEIKH